jgi:ABC-type bacteriocin/lantibiotic exporter with double-glycine peptidase domain
VASLGRIHVKPKLKDLMRAEAVEHEAFGPTARLSRLLYEYIWRTSRSKQIAICLLTLVMAPLSLVPLELQRRIVDHALLERKLDLLALLGGAYLAIIVLQGGLKFLLNMLKGAAAETIARDLRLKIMRRSVREHKSEGRPDINAGTVVSMLAAETENVSSFAGDALAVPLLSAGTILYVAGYLLWVQPAIAILAVVVYFPQVVIVPATQRTINRLARLRIQLVRNLGHLASRLFRRSTDHRKRPAGSFLIDRLYRVRIWIYFRKYLLAALGNFLDSMGTLIVLMVGGYLVIQGKTQVGTLVVFISGLGRIADPWDQIINFYREVSNTAVMFDMIAQRLK